MTIQAHPRTNEKPRSNSKTVAPSVRVLLHSAQQLADLLWAKARMKFGISGRQFDVLLAATKCEPCSQTRLVQETGIDRSTTADLVRRLARRGLLGRKRSRLDSREQVITVTSDGQEAVREGRKISAQIEAKLIAPLSAEESGDLADMLSRITTRSSA